MSTSIFNFTPGLLGFHVYGETWKPLLNQIITFKQEKIAVMTIFNSRHDEINGNLTTINSWAHSTQTKSFYLVSN